MIENNKQPLLLLVNDLHVSKDNIPEFNKNWDEMLSVCERMGIYKIVVGGDMFTSRSSQTLATLQAVKAKLEETDRKDIRVLIAEGNHDKVDPEAEEGYNHLWDTLPNIDVVGTFEVLGIADSPYRLLVISYFSEDGKFLEVLDKAVNHAVRFCKDKSNIILYIHEGVHGALGNFCIDKEVPQEALLGFKAVLCGHYHDRCKIKGTNIEYIGASRQHNFGEDEEKGYTVIYTDGSSEFIKNEANTRYRTVSLTASELYGLEVDPDPRYKNKLKVTCSEQESKTIDRQQLLALGFDKVEIIMEDTAGQPTVRESIKEKYDIRGIRKEYRSYCAENGMDCEMGLNYLKD